MGALFLIIALLFGVGGLVFHILILIDAFQDEIWKGLLGLLCGLYLLYYALFEYDGDNKVKVVGGWIFCICASILFRVLAMAAS